MTKEKEIEELKEIIHQIDVGIDYASPRTVWLGINKYVRLKLKQDRLKRK